MFSVAVVEPGMVEFVDIPKPKPGAYDALVKTEISYLCNRTDRKLIEGHFPGVDQYPLLLGHESVGIVESVGEKVRTFSPGDRTVGGVILSPPDPKYFSFFGGFSEYILIRDHTAMIQDGVADEKHGWSEYYQIQRVVPKNIPVEGAGLLCTWREVYSAFGDFHLQSGNDIVVFGAGPVGLSFVKFAKLLGFGYVGSVDPHSEKRDKSRKMGADQTFTPEDQELREKREKPLDAVIDAVGDKSIINMCLPHIRMAGSICMYGVIDEPEFMIQKSKGPLNFNLIIHQYPTRQREAEAQESICAWIDEGKLDYREFITAEFPITKIHDAVELIKSRSALKVLLRF